MFAHTTTTTENATDFEPVAKFDDFGVSIEFTSTLAVNMSRDEFDLLTFAIRTGYAEHLERTAELDRQLDAKFGSALPPPRIPNLPIRSRWVVCPLWCSASPMFRLCPRRRARCNQQRGCSYTMSEERPRP